jgi:zinc transporter ZupT
MDKKEKESIRQILSRNPGRVAGLWYLLLILLGPLRLIYIPGKLFVTGNPGATVSNITAHERLFRLGIATDLAAAIVLVLVTLAFYRLFAEVDQRLAVMVVIFGGVMPALLYFVGVVCDLGALMVVHRESFLSVFDQPQQDTLAMFLLKLRDAQNTAAETLWGVWLIPLATLVYRSRFLPRFLGVWLAFAGIAYLAMSFTGVLWPQYRGKVFALSQPATFGEIALTLWLVIRGSKASTGRGSVLYTNR